MPSIKPAGSRSVRPFTGNLSDIDLRLLRVFRAVVEGGGFTGAEAALGTVKSTISKHVSDLEGRLGVRLCRRGRSGFALTEEGERVYRATLQLFISLEDFKSKINSVHSRLVGTLAVGFVDTVVTDPGSPLQAALTNYGRRAPDVHVRLSVGTTTDIEKGVLDATLHVGVVIARNPLPGLAYRPLYEELSLLYCARNHPLFTRPDSEIDARALGECAFVKRSYSEDEQTTALKGMFRAEATADHAEAVAMLVLTGRFIGFLPQHYASGWIASGQMRALTPRTVSYSTRLMTVTRSGVPQAPLVEQFLNDLAAAASVSRTASPKDSTDGRTSSPRSLRA